MSSPLVSILMPVYNAEENLKDAIDSIINQVFKDFELIIINDGSQDSSETIIKNYTDNRIRYIDNGINKGLIKTLNIGVQLCKGKYIARMDSDDISHPERLLKQVKYLNSNPDYVLCGTRCDFILSGKKRFFNVVSKGDDLNIRSFFLINSPFVHPSVMFRKDIVTVNNICYRDEFKDAEDYMFWIEISEHGKLAILEDILLHYRLSPSQISQSNNRKQLNNAEIIRNFYFNKITRNQYENILNKCAVSFFDIRFIIKTYIEKYPDLALFFIRKDNVNKLVKLYLLLYIIKYKRFWQILPGIKRVII